jgi:hypothetical protein
MAKLHLWGLCNYLKNKAFFLIKVFLFMSLYIPNFRVFSSNSVSNCFYFSNERGEQVCRIR